MPYDFIPTLFEQSAIYIQEYLTVFAVELAKITVPCLIGIEVIKRVARKILSASV